MFFNDLLTSLFFEVLVKHLCPVILTCDFNIRIDRAEDHNASVFAELIDSLDIVQHINCSTQDCVGTLDLVITKSSNNISNISTIWRSSPDHAKLMFLVAANKKDESGTTITA